MLNICIPVLNYDVTNLVAEIYKQCKSAEIEFNILVFEDGSQDSYIKINSRLKSDLEITHIVSKNNIGRSAGRNLLADNAKEGKLIFIDCDSAIPDQNYINNYLRNQDKEIVCGGTIYLPDQKTTAGSLRYKYGINREMKTAQQRSQNPNAAFATNNFMISAEVFKTIRFREFLKDYGHEDTLFGYELEKNGFTIFHIDNPVVHEGIEQNDIFLSKTLAGLNNLILIEKSGFTDSNFTNNIRIVKTYSSLKRLGMPFIIYTFFKIFKNNVEKHLLFSKNPCLMLFDFYKIGYYCKIKRNN